MLVVVHVVVINCYHIIVFLKFISFCGWYTYGYEINYHLSVWQTETLKWKEITCADFEQYPPPLNWGHQRCIWISWVPYLSRRMGTSTAYSWWASSWNGWKRHQFLTRQWKPWPEQHSTIFFHTFHEISRTKEQTLAVSYSHSYVNCRKLQRRGLPPTTRVQMGRWRGSTECSCRWSDAHSRSDQQTGIVSCRYLWLQSDATWTASLGSPKTTWCWEERSHNPFSWWQGWGKNDLSSHFCWEVS